MREGSNGGGGVRENLFGESSAEGRLWRWLFSALRCNRDAEESNGTEARHLRQRRVKLCVLMLGGGM